jgi:hypothetical protein
MDRREVLGAVCAGAVGAGSAFAAPYQSVAASLRKQEGEDHRYQPEV